MLLSRASGATTGLGLPVAFVLLLCCETGVPVPVPADILMVAIGGAVSAGTLPWWLAVLGVELVAVVGTAALLLAARGPAAVLITRLGPRVGLGPERLARATGLLERRGRPALAVGRATPGLRTVTVVAAAASAVPLRRALPVLAIGSTLFLQGHLVLGYALGPALRAVLRRAAGPALVVAAVVALCAAAVWLARRRKGGERTWAEGCCPACLAARYLIDTD